MEFYHISMDFSANWETRPLTKEETDTLINLAKINGSQEQDFSSEKPMITFFFRGGADLMEFAQDALIYFTGINVEHIEIHGYNLEGEEADISA